MIEKEGNKTIVTGLVEDHVVDTYGGNYTYDLQVGYESIDSVIRSYEGKKVRVTIEVVKDEDNDGEESNEHSEDTW